MISLLLYNETGGVTTKEVFLDADTLTEDEVRLNYRSSRTMKGNKRQDWYATYKKFNISFSMIMEDDFNKLREIIQKQSGKTMLVYNNTFYQVIHESDTFSDTPKWSSVKNCYVYDGSLALEEILYDLEELQQVDPVQFNYASGTYEYSIYLRMTTETLGSKIYYTDDGNDPTTSSKLYSEPILISSSKTIKAKAVKTNLLDSNITTGTYNIGILEPIISPASRSSSLPITVSIEKNPLSQILSHRIFYTTDGSDPASTSTEYTGSFTLMQNGNIIIKAIAYSDDLLLFSEVVSETYILNMTDLISYSPAGGEYTGSQVVNLSKVNSSMAGDIQHSLNNTTWTTGASVTLTENSTLYSRINNNGAYTSTQSQYYTIKVLPVEFLDGSKIIDATYSIDKSTTITLKTEQSGATVKYSTNGGTDWSSGVPGSSEATVITSSNLTILAYASKPDLVDSIQTSLETEYRLKTPIISPVGGTNRENFNEITITYEGTIPDGAEIWYGIDTDPDTPYATSFTLTGNCEIRAEVHGGGYTQSVQNIQEYTYKTATPMAFEQSGSYSDQFTTTLSCNTTGAAIRYTTDGTIPTSVSALYEGNPIPINKSLTLNIKAFKSGMADSELKSYTYTLKVADVNITPSDRIQYNAIDVVMSCSTPDAQIRYTIDGIEPTTESLLYDGAIPTNVSTEFKAKAFKGSTTSNTTTISYDIQCDIGIKPISGKYPMATPLEISMESLTNDATIYYTIDGTVPSVDSTEYINPFTISETTTIKAIAISPTIGSSSIFTKTYTKDSPIVITPHEIEDLIEFCECSGRQSSANGFIGLYYNLYTLKAPVTQYIFNKFYSNDYSYYKTNDGSTFNYPAEFMTKYDAIDFCNKLSNEQSFVPFYIFTILNKDSYGRIVKISNFSINSSANGWRLPYDYEWFVLARGGNHGNPTRFAGSDIASDVAVYNASPTSVMTKQPNKLNLFDMSGLIWEMSNYIQNFNSETDLTKITSRCGYFESPNSNGLAIDSLDNLSNKNDGINRTALSVIGFRPVRPLIGPTYNSIFVEAGTSTYDLPYTVSISEDIWVYKFPITRGLFQLLMGYDNSLRNRTYDSTLSSNMPYRFLSCPVESVTWYDAVYACNKLSEMTGLAPYYTISGITRDPNGSISSATVVREEDGSEDGYYGWRLPTLAEWQYCSEGGKDNLYETRYSGSDDLNEVGWYTENLSTTIPELLNKAVDTKPIALKQPNYLGLYDMSGNVYEWIDSEPYPGSAYVAGGAYDSQSSECTVAAFFNANIMTKSTKAGTIGFRPVRTQ